MNRLIIAGLIAFAAILILLAVLSERLHELSCDVLEIRTRLLMLGEDLDSHDRLEAERFQQLTEERRTP